MSISVIVTSPPYNLGVRYRSYDDTLPRDRYLDWTGAWIEGRGARARPGGSLFLNVGAKPTDPWTALDVAQAARRAPQLQNTIHWIKSIAIDRDAAGAAPASTGPERRALQADQQRAVRERLPRVHLPLHAGRPDAARPPRHRRAVPGRVERRRAGAAAAGNRRCRGNTWFIPYETIQSRDQDRPHPATFPPRIAGALPAAPRGRRAGRVAMDPFLGLGNTRGRGRRLGVDFIGVEMDEHYLVEAIARVKRAIREGAE